MRPRSEAATPGKKEKEIKALYPALFPDGLFEPPNDNRRLFDLTHVIHEDKKTISYHRLDRAMVAFTPGLGRDPPGTADRDLG